MSLNVTLLVPTSAYFQYDGSNAQELADHFTFPYDPESRSVFTVAVQSEEGGAVALSWEGGWRNHDNTVWEIHNQGVTPLAVGDYLLAEVGANGLTRIPASLIGSNYAIIEASA